MSESENAPVKRGPGRPPKKAAPAQDPLASVAEAAIPPEFLRPAPQDDVRMTLADLLALFSVVQHGQKLQFHAVNLDYEFQRLGGHKGLASSSTTRFSKEAGCNVELDTATGLVTITHTASGTSYTIPRERVRYFEPRAK